MSLELHINGRHAPGSRDALGVKVPTSCNKNGKCLECLVEVMEGMELLSPRAPEDSHHRERFRLSCRCKNGSELGQR